MSLIKIDNSEERAKIMVDFLGNIFLHHNEKYYYITLNNDIKCGVELIEILNIKQLKRNYEESFQLKRLIKSGVIKNNGQTLQSRVITNLNNESEHNNEFAYTDKSYHERQYFKTVYDDDSDNETDDNGSFYINGVNENDGFGLKYAELLFTCDNNYETILIDGNIESKKIISTVEKKNGYCDSRLSIYTNGIFRCNFFNCSKWAKLGWFDGNLIATYYHEDVIDE